MNKKIGDLTISELLNYFKNKCTGLECGMCHFRYGACGSVETELIDFIEAIGENTLIEVDDE